MSVEYRVATLADALDIAPRLREQDRVEVAAASDTEDVQAALLASLDRSKRTWVAVIDGRPECIFGIGELNQHHGVPWMLGTPAILKHQRRLLVDARSIVEDMQDAYRVLYNMTHADNAVAIRWLKRLGFTFGAPFQHNSHTFLPFYRHRNV